jgi:hypothetical protein
MRNRGGRGSAGRGRALAGVLTGVLAGVLTLGAAGCRGNPVAPSEHASPGGFEVVLGQEALVRVHRGATIGPGLAVVPGGELGPLTVHFLDEQGARIVTGATFYLEIDAADPAIAVFEPSAAGSFQGRLRGLAPGTTALEVRLMHGRVGRGHADFVGSTQVTVGG